MDSANWRGELGGYEQHPLSAIFPPMLADAFSELRSDISRYGLRQAIVLFQGKVLDGWNRCRCCIETGTPLRTEEFQGDEDEALAFVLSANLARRHLSTSDRALIAAKLATRRPGAPRQIDQMSHLRIAEAAEKLAVSPNSVKRARKLLGNPELLAKVSAHKLTVSKAERLLPARQPRVVAADGYTIEAWRALPEDERAALLGLRDRKARLNRQSATEDGNAIDWARWSFSPVTGCRHGCTYCYISGFVPMEPVFHSSRLAAPLNTAPPATHDPRDRSIFVCSLADLFGRWVPADWIEAILDVARACPGWTFIFCTKFPQRYLEFDFPPNVMLGTTIDLQARVANAESAFAQLRERNPKAVLWAGCEPLLEPLQFSKLHLFDRIVLG
jgi:hypothetical protein